MTGSSAKASESSNFRRFFLRGLGVLLPTILTIWILMAIYQFVDVNIASPINSGVRELILQTSPWPDPADEFVITPDEAAQKLPEKERPAWILAQRDPKWLELRARRLTLEKHWSKVAIGRWEVLNIIGLLIAVILIYTVGFLLGGLIGRGLLKRVEAMIRQVPVVKAIYPSVKQVTDFFFGDGSDPSIRFDKVVAVEYPRKGIWSVGLVTGDTMQTIQRQSGKNCITVFVPSSPTPFTGYTITEPVEDTIEQHISIDDALKFTVRGGVVVPNSEAIPAPDNKRSIAAVSSAANMENPTS